MGEEEQTCSLLEGSWALIAQILLGMIAFSTLIVKRAKEDPKRPLNIWLMDVSKQIISLFMAHTLAILAAMLTTSLTHLGTSQCAWYFVMYSLDTIIGTMITYMMHTSIISGLQAAVNDRKLQEGSTMMSLAQYIITCGDYGDPVSLRRWFWQVIEWTFCVLSARIFCGGMVCFLCFFYSQRYFVRSVDL